EQEDTAYVTPDADMAVTVSDSPDPVAPNGNITYTVQVTNNGPDTAPNATLAMFNNGTLKFVSATVPAGWNCTLPAVNATPTFNCTNPSFANGGNSTFTFVVNADSTVLGINDGTVSSVFTAGSAVSDPNNANNQEQEDTAYVTPDADISVTNSDSPDPVSPGANITYTQSIANGGPDAAPNATFSETLPASVGFQSISAPAGFSCTTPAVGASGAINCSNPSFASGASGTITLVVNVIASSGSVLNTIVGGSDVQDPDSLDNSATVTTTIITPLIADLGISKFTNSDNAAAGASLAYTITLTNNGPDAASNVVVTDALLPELLFQSITAPAGFSCTTPAVGTNGTITCTAATMPANTFVQFTLIVQLTPTAVGPINNTASASSDTDDNNAGNDAGSAAPVTVGGSGSGIADLSASKTTQTTTAGPGDTVTYTITVTNNGPNAANEVIVQDTLPAALLFQSITPAAGFTCTTPAVGATGTITCTGGPLANAATATFTLVTTIAPSATGTFANAVTVSSSDADPVSGNSTSTTAPIVVATADLAITKTTNSTTAPNGSTVTYTITVTNNGPDAATNVVVNDDLPAGLQFVSAVPSQGSCSGTDPFSCSLGTLNDGASATITVQALVTATSGTVSNTATVTADTDDGNPGNNGSSTTPIPVTPGSGAEPVAGIPTLSEWALLALMAMLGFVAIRKL
ncbi:MAG TPA: IPTL-CTERM sorting domain-containing protein, partial [Thermoanaerobaculia bacterium]